MGPFEPRDILPSIRRASLALKNGTRNGEVFVKMAESYGVTLDELCVLMLLSGKTAKDRMDVECGVPQDCAAS